MSTSYVMAHTWDYPEMVSHFGTYHKQIMGSRVIPWMSTLCGRTVLANGDRSGTQACEICEEAMDMEDDDE